MSNQFKRELTEDDFEEEAKSTNTEKIELPRNFFTLIFTEGVISKQAATGMLPFIIFVAFLAMIYIANRHFAENNIREIDKLNKQVRELNWDFKTLKADLMLKSTQTEVSKQVDILGLKEPIEPPKKIIISIEEN
ncbi:MAG: FtsL-like putative cell division protein [Daejeonella sp.]